MRNTSVISLKIVSVYCLKDSIASPFVLKRNARNVPNESKNDFVIVCINRQIENKFLSMSQPDLNALKVGSFYLDPTKCLFFILLVPPLNFAIWTTLHFNHSNICYKTVYLYRYMRCSNSKNNCNQHIWAYLDFKFPIYLTHMGTQTICMKTLKNNRCGTFIAL